MSWFAYTPLVWPILASTVFVVAIGSYIWRQYRTAAGARPLALSAFLLAAVCLLVAAEVSTTDPRVLAMWFVLADAIMLPAALFALWFAFDYAGLRDRVPSVVVPVLVFAVVARTLLVLVDLSLVRDGQTPLVGGVGQGLGPLGFVFTGMVLGALLLATTVLVLLFVRSPAHRVPVALILVGHVSLRVAYLYVALGSGDASRAVVGVLAFDAVALVYAIALTRFRLFDLVPIARETIVGQMPDPIFVLDRWDRVVELNPAAERLLGTSAGRASGKPARMVLGSFPQLVAALAEPDLGSAEIVTGSGDGPGVWELRVTPLHDGRGSPIGRLAILHDLTEMRRAEAALLRHERALAAAREREHMARDLHDSIGQVLAHAAMQSDAARQHLAEGRVTEADQLLRRLADAARDSHREVRGYIHELHAGPSDGQPLADTLRRYLDSFSRHHEISTELSIDRPDAGLALAADEQIQVFHVVQEALSNARRHADANLIRVRLGGDPSRLLLEVADDGLGFDVDTVDGQGLGLRFMQERAAELGGRLLLSSRIGEGTRVVLDLPRLASDAGALASERPVALGGAS